MLSIDLATNDIDVVENEVIKEDHLKRQAKRFKAGSTLAEVDDLTQVGEAEVGERLIGLMDVHSRKISQHSEVHGKNLSTQETLALILETVERTALNLQQKTRSLHACARARQYNSGAYISEHRVMALPNFNNVFPVGFPLTCGEFNAMSIAQLDKLLSFYEFPQFGNRAEKLQTLRQHCSIKAPNTQ